MKRGDLVTVAVGGGFGGKPRRALVVQSDAFGDTSTVVLALFTSKLEQAGLIRLRVMPDSGNNLDKPSDLMIDVLVTARREKVGKTVGQLSDADLERVDRALTVFLGLADRSP